MAINTKRIVRKRYYGKHINYYNIAIARNEYMGLYGRYPKTIEMNIGDYRNLLEQSVQPLNNWLSGITYPSPTLLGMDITLIGDRTAKVFEVTS